MALPGPSRGRGGYRGRGIPPIVTSAPRLPEDYDLTSRQSRKVATQGPPAVRTVSRGLRGRGRGVGRGLPRGGAVPIRGGGGGRGGGLSSPAPRLPPTAPAAIRRQPSHPSLPTRPAPQGRSTSRSRSRSRSRSPYSRINLDRSLHDRRDVVYAREYDGYGPTYDDDWERRRGHSPPRHNRRYSPSAPVPEHPLQPRTQPSQTSRPIPTGPRNPHHFSGSPSAGPSRPSTPPLSDDFRPLTPPLPPVDSYRPLRTSNSSLSEDKGKGRAIDMTVNRQATVVGLHTVGNQATTLATVASQLPKPFTAMPDPATLEPEPIQKMKFKPLKAGPRPPNQIRPMPIPPPGPSSLVAIMSTHQDAFLDSVRRRDNEEAEMASINGGPASVVQLPVTGPSTKEKVKTKEKAQGKSKPIPTPPIYTDDKEEDLAIATPPKTKKSKSNAIPPPLPESIDIKPDLSTLEDDAPPPDDTERTNGVWAFKKSEIPKCWSSSAATKSSARKQFFAEKKNELRQQGRKYIKHYWRDDGFGIEWENIRTSPILIDHSRESSPVEAESTNGAVTPAEVLAPVKATKVVETARNQSASRTSPLPTTSSTTTTRKGIAPSHADMPVADNAASNSANASSIAPAKSDPSRPSQLPAKPTPTPSTISPAVPPPEILESTILVPWPPTLSPDQDKFEVKPEFIAWRHEQWVLASKVDEDGLATRRVEFKMNPDGLLVTTLPLHPGHPPIRAFLPRSKSRTMSVSSRTEAGGANLDPSLDIDPSSMHALAQGTSSMTGPSLATITPDTKAMARSVESTKTIPWPDHLATPEERSKDPAGLKAWKQPYWVEAAQLDEEGYITRKVKMTPTNAGLKIQSRPRGPTEMRIKANSSRDMMDSPTKSGSSPWEEQYTVPYPKEYSTSERRMADSSGFKSWKQTHYKAACRVDSANYITRDVRMAPREDGLFISARTLQPGQKSVPYLPKTSTSSPRPHVTSIAIPTPSTSSSAVPKQGPKWATAPVDSSSLTKGKKRARRESDVSFADTILAEDPDRKPDLPPEPPKAPKSKKRMESPEKTAAKLIAIDALQPTTNGQITTPTTPKPKKKAKTTTSTTTNSGDSTAAPTAPRPPPTPPVPAPPPSTTSTSVPSDALPSHLEVLKEAMRAKLKKIERWSRIQREYPDQAGTINGQIDRAQEEIFQLDGEIEEERERLGIRP